MIWNPNEDLESACRPEAHIVYIFILRHFIKSGIQLKPQMRSSGSAITKRSHVMTLAGQSNAAQMSSRNSSHSSAHSSNMTPLSARLLFPPWIVHTMGRAWNKLLTAQHSADSGWDAVVLISFLENYHLNVWNSTDRLNKCVFNELLMIFPTEQQTVKLCEGSQYWVNE